MTDTAQPETAAETEATPDSLEAAADAFKIALGQAPPRLRDEQGKFASAPAEAQEIDAEDEAGPIGEAEPEAESHDEEDADEAADEAQPEAVDLPTSWPAEQAETWKSLPPETQAFIAEREGQRDAAVNAKFQEAANVKKANEAIITEANTNRQQLAEATDFVLSLVTPQKPSPTMLNPQSSDYNPDGYHLALAQYEQTNDTIRALHQQRQSLSAQQEQEAEATRQQRIAEINQKVYPALVKDVPAFADPATADEAFMEIARYALASGVPEETPLDSFLAPELHIVWKAMQYDKMKSAQGKVQPKAAKPSAPPVKPGVTTPKSAVEAARRKQDFDRLGRDGSIEAGAAVFKNIFKGSR